MDFKPSAAFSVGMELELQLLDPTTLVPDASLPAPLLDLAPVLVTVVPVRRMPAVYPFGVSAPRPPLRL